jgi:hypothetical protein
MNGVGYLRMADATRRVAPDADIHSCAAVRLVWHAGNVSIRPTPDIHSPTGLAPKRMLTDD